MLTKEQILQALQQLKDELNILPLVDLGWIRDIVSTSDRVALTIVVAKNDNTYKAMLHQQAMQALSQTGAPDVHIRFRLATDYEQNEANKRRLLQAEDGEKPAQTAVSYIAVTSGKGGVGKSTVTANLAVSLASLGKRVGLIDADIYGFSIPEMMNIKETPESDDGRMLPVERFGVKIISMGFFVKEHTPVIWRGPMLGKMLNHFINEVQWGELDYLLLDLPPGTGDIALDVHQMLPESSLLLVTTPHSTASTVAARAGMMALQTNHPLLGIVENMAYIRCPHCETQQYLFGQGGGARLSEELKTPLLAQLPLEQLPSSIEGTIYPLSTESGKKYRLLAEHIVATVKK